MAKKDLRDQINGILVNLTKEQKELEQKILNENANNNEQDTEDYIAITKNIDILKLIKNYLDIYNKFPMQWLLWMFNNSITNFEINADSNNNINDLKNEIIGHSKTTKLLIFLMCFYAILFATLFSSLVLTLVLLAPLAANIGFLLALFIPVLELFVFFKVLFLLVDTMIRSFMLENLKHTFKTLSDEQDGYDFVKEIDEKKLEINKNGIISCDNKFVFIRSGDDSFLEPNIISFTKTLNSLNYETYIKVNDNTKIYLYSEINKNLSEADKTKASKALKIFSEITPETPLSGEKAKYLLTYLNGKYNFTEEEIENTKNILNYQDESPLTPTTQEENLLKSLWEKYENNLTIEEAKYILEDFKKKHNEENKEFYLKIDSNKLKIEIIERYEYEKEFHFKRDSNKQEDVYIKNQKLFCNDKTNKIIRDSINKASLNP